MKPSRSEWREFPTHPKTPPVLHPSTDAISAAMNAMDGEENKCPVCEGRLKGARWFAQPGHRYMDLAACPEHGKFLIRIRLSEQADGLIRVSRLTYEATSEAAEAYARRAEKADPEDTGARPRRRRRRRSGSSAPKTEEVKETE